MNKTQNLEVARDVIHLYNQNVVKYLDNPAITIGDRTLSYRELNSLVNNFSKNFKKNERVVVGLEKNIEFYVTILSILAAGACYIPVDLSQKSLDLKQVIKSNRVNLIVATHLPDELHNSIALVLPNVELESSVSNMIVVGSNTFDPLSLAYVIYTSGSTGNPKGVKISRNNISSFIISILNYELFEPGLKWTQFARHTFDLSVFEIFGCFLSGGHLFPMNQIALPARFMSQNSIEVWTTTPSGIDLVHFDAQSSTREISTLRYVLTCGEPMTKVHLTKLRQINSSTTLINTYGPTEATVLCSLSIHNLTEEEIELFEDGYLGEPIDGHKFILYSPNLHGVGELVIEGPQVSSGYVEESFNGQKFKEIDCLINQYVSGDLVLKRSKKFYFKGRTDQQIKHRGYRIELAGIEARFRNYFNISAIVLYSLDHFVYVIHSMESPENFVSGILQITEVYERPFCVHVVEEFALTLNGKVNKSAYSTICEFENCTQY